MVIAQNFPHDLKFGRLKLTNSNEAELSSSRVPSNIVLRFVHLNSKCFTKAAQGNVKAWEEDRFSRYEAFVKSKNMNIEHHYTGNTHSHNVGFPNLTFLFSSNSSAYNPTIVES